MIRPEVWQQFVLMVTVRNRITQESFLLKYVPQEQFIERWLEKWGTHGDDRTLVIHDMHVNILSETSYEMLEVNWPDERKMEG